MKRYLSVPILLCLGIIPSFASEMSTEEIDRTVWAVISSTVAAQDIVGMAKTYHPDAALVSTRGTVAIAEQLSKWGDAMEEAKRAGASASVSFRFRTRQDGESTAFEVGIFKYTETDSAGVQVPVFVPFEALLVKKDGRWLLVMERQLELDDESAWDALE